MHQPAYGLFARVAKAHIAPMRRLILLVGLASCGGLSRGGSAPAATSPPSFVRSTAEAQVTRVIDVRDGLTRSQAMRLLTDVLALRFTVEVTDARAGFAMTAVTQAHAFRDAGRYLDFQGLVMFDSARA